MKMYYSHNGIIDEVEVTRQTEHSFWHISRYSGQVVMERKGPAWRQRYFEKKSDAVIFTREELKKWIDRLNNELAAAGRLLGKLIDENFSTSGEYIGG